VAIPSARVLTRKLSVEEEALLRVEEMNKVVGGGGDNDGTPGKMQRRASVRDRMQEMEKARLSGSISEELSLSEPSERVVTAPPVPAKSMRVARLIEKAHQEQMLKEAKMKEAHHQAGGGGEGGNEGEDGGDEVPVHHVGEWNCALCSKRNHNSKHLCGTCGRPRGMIATKPRRDLTISHHAMHAALQARNKNAGGGVGSGGGGVSGGGVAFGRTTKPGGDALPSKPEKNFNMMAELQAKLKRRASN
jgi:hypothetical protein